MITLTLKIQVFYNTTHAIGRVLPDATLLVLLHPGDESNTIL
jgi:hypothetical protein